MKLTNNPLTLLDQREENIGNVILSDQNAPPSWNTVDQTNWKYRHVNTYGTVIVKMLVWIITRWSCVCHWYWFEEYIIVIITSIVNMGTQHNNTPTWTLAFFQNLSPCFCWWTLVWCECVHFLMCLGTLSVHYALITDNVWFFLSEHVITLAIHFKFHRAWLF